MTITPVAEVAGLYLVDQVYDIALLDQFLAEELSQVPTKSVALQEHWVFRKNYKLFPKQSCWNQLQQSVDYTLIHQLGYHKRQALDTVYWIDLPGFTTGVHQDDPGVFASLQVYLDTAEGLGTQFYSNYFKLIFTVPYVKNTGYLLINSGQRHGFPQSVQKTRYSTYTWLTPKS